MNLVLAASQTEVDFGSFLAAYVYPGLGLIVMAVLGAVAKKVNDHYNLVNGALLQTSLDSAVTHGIALGQSKIDTMAARGDFRVDVKSEVAASALTYAIDHAKPAADALGYTPQKLAEKIEATIALNTTPPEQSMAIQTPPATSTVTTTTGAVEHLNVETGTAKPGYPSSTAQGPFLAPKP